MLYIDFSVVPPGNPLVRIDRESGNLGADSGAEANDAVIMLIASEQLPGKTYLLLAEELHQ